MATGPNYYDIKVAEQAHADATKALQNTVTDYAYLQAALTRQAIEKTLTKPEIELLYTKNNGLTVNNVPADRQQAVQTELKKITAANTEYARLQKAIDTSQTAVKSTQLNLNSAINGVRITQGKSGPDLSPAIDPNAKQAPYTVRPPGTTLGVTHNTLTGTRQTTTGRTTNTLTGTRQPTSPPGANNSDLLNNPTGLILGATALTAITRNPNLISSIGNGIGRFFNNAGDILPVSSNVPAAPAPVNPASVPASAATPTAGETTATAAPVADAGTAQEQAQLLAGITENPAPIATTGDEALAAAQAAQEVRDLQIAAESSTPVDPYTEGLLLEQEQLRQFQAEEALNARLDRAAELDLANSGDAALEAAARAREVADLQVAAESANPVSPLDTGYVSDAEQIARMGPASETTASGVTTAAGKVNAQTQSTLQARINQPSAADWRVRLQLAAGANYLYKENSKDLRGILAPLWDTDGVVFPYTPSIETAYKAKYDAYDLVHSNYRGYFYKNSNVEEISVKGTFTAQDTKEAQYLLAVIHFFRSVTKMFYGQDPQAGTPPPLVFLSGLGQYQFNQHPCVVSSFNYSLPTDVDYIRADGFNNIGVNLENRRSLGSGPALGGSLGTIQRLLTNGLFSGAQPTPPWAGAVTQNVSNQNSVNSTYVPTKMEISISLLPMQTRNQISQQFSLQGFAQGRLLTQGFW